MHFSTAKNSLLFCFVFISNRRFRRRCDCDTSKKSFFVALHTIHCFFSTKSFLLAFFKVNMCALSRAQMTTSQKMNIYMIFFSYKTKIIRDERIEMDVHTERVSKWTGGVHATLRHLAHHRVLCPPPVSVLGQTRNKSLPPFARRLYRCIELIRPFLDRSSPLP